MQLTDHRALTPQNQGDTRCLQVKIIASSYGERTLAETVPGGLWAPHQTRSLQTNECAGRLGTSALAPKIFPGTHHDGISYKLDSCHD